MTPEGFCITPEEEEFIRRFLGLSDGEQDLGRYILLILSNWEILSEILSREIRGIRHEPLDPKMEKSIE